MNIRQQLIALCGVVADEAERNTGFRRKLEAALTSGQPDLLIERESQGRQQKPRDERTYGTDGGRRDKANLCCVSIFRR
jgi:hypothetical protein